MQCPILDATAILAQFINANDDDIVERLQTTGSTQFQAEKYLAFIPLAFARILLNRLRGGERLEFSQIAIVSGRSSGNSSIRLVDVEEFREATELAKTSIATSKPISLQNFKNVCYRSCEFQVANGLMAQGAKLPNIVFTPPVLARLAEVPEFERWYNSLAHPGLKQSP